jgi:cell division protein DivIC
MENDPQNTREADGRKNRVLRLNNDYTNEQLKKQQPITPHRRYLGLILVTVVIVLTVPTYGLIQSYQSLQSARNSLATTTAQSKQTDYQASSDQQLIKNMRNNFYIEKFARSQYAYSLPGEKLFTTPSSGLGNSTTGSGSSSGTGQ